MWGLLRGILGTYMNLLHLHCSSFRLPEEYWRVCTLGVQFGGPYINPKPTGHAGLDLCKGHGMVVVATTVSGTVKTFMKHILLLEKGRLKVPYSRLRWKPMMPPFLRASCFVGPFLRFHAARGTMLFSSRGPPQLLNPISFC